MILDNLDVVELFVKLTFLNFVQIGILVSDQLNVIQLLLDVCFLLPKHCTVLLPLEQLG